MSKIYTRCNICDVVSDDEICAEWNEVYYGAFVPDPDQNRDGFICSPCNDAVQDALDQYAFDDLDVVMEKDFELDMVYFAEMREEDA